MPQSDKVMIVTGASRGIGAAVALLAARRGYAVCVNYRNRRDAADEVVRAIEADGGRAVAVGADVADEAQIVQLFQTADRALGRVDALVNNAGGPETPMRVECMDAARVARILPATAGGSPGEYVDYAASKGALDTLTIGLSKEVAGDGIRVNAVRPSTIYTDMHASGGEPGRVDRLASSIPLQRGGTVQEVAGAVMWFFS